MATPNPSAMHAESKIGAIRLVGGKNRSQGRLEVAVGGLFGSVCAGDFGKEEAQVRARRHCKCTGHLLIKSYTCPRTS